MFIGARKSRFRVMVNNLMVRAKRPPPVGYRVNPISTGLFYPVVALGEGGSTPFHEIASRHPRALKLGGLIAYIMFYKIC